MSHHHYTFAPELEEQLNDIDEFIRGQCGDELSAELQSEMCGEYKAGETPALWHPNTWNIKGSDPRLMAPSSAKMIGPSEEVFLEDNRPETLGPGVEVQILNLMDSYDKRTKKVCGKCEYRLATSEVTMMIRANDEIRKIRVHVQRCRQAAVRTHDTIGPVELQASTQQSDNLCTIITVNLDSAHKTVHGDSVYRLEKSEILERNKWELIVTVELATGVIASVKSKPFRITTRISHRSRNLQHQPGGMENDVHRVYHRIPSQCCKVIDYSELPESPEFMELEEIALESLDTNAIVNRVSSKLRQELAKCHLNDGFPSPTQSSPADPYVIGRVVLRPDTKLDKQKVSGHYNRDLRIRYVVEQPDLPSLLKLMNRRTTCMTSGRRRANGFKTAEEDFWWACGLCFFERRKKSTVKAHVVQRVCQKTSLRKEIRQRRRVFGHMKRYSSCELNSKELEEFEPLPWESSLSV